MSGTSSRLLSLLSLLQARRDWPGGTLADRLEISPRTVRRDIARLGDLGYPVESLSGPGGGYRLAAGSAMPPLLLNDDEAIAIAIGLSTAAQSAVTGIAETSVQALVKLEQVLPRHLRRRVRDLLSSTSTIAGPDHERVDPGHLSMMAAACRDRERVRFTYRRRDDAESRREADPHALVNHGRRWYLVAWDRGREDWRTFRLDRVARPAARGVLFEPRPVPGGDAGAFVESGLSAALPGYEAVVTLHAPAAEVRERARRLWGTVEPIDAENCRYRSSDVSLEWLTARLTMLGVEFTVHEPPERVAHIRSLTGRLTRATA